MGFVHSQHFEYVKRPGKTTVAVCFSVSRSKMKVPQDKLEMGNKYKYLGETLLLGRYIAQRPSFNLN